MLQTLYSKPPGTGIIKQQKVSLQIALPDSENGLNSPQMTTTDSVPKKLNENAKSNFPSEDKKHLLNNRNHYTEQHRKNCTKI